MSDDNELGALLLQQLARSDVVELRFNEASLHWFTELAKVELKLPNLRHYDVTIDGAGAAALCSALANGHPIISLTHDRRGTSLFDGRLLFQALSSAPNGSVLRQLTVGHTVILDDAFASVLRRCTNLTSLSCGCEFSSASVAALAEHPALQSLDFYCRCGALKAHRLLSPLLRRSSTLIYLSVGLNLFDHRWHDKDAPFTEELQAIAALSAAFKANSSLLRLRLSGDGVHYPELAPVLKQHPTLTELSLDLNWTARQSPSAIVSRVQSMLSVPSLTNLDMSLITEIVPLPLNFLELLDAAMALRSLGFAMGFTADSMRALGANRTVRRLKSLKFHDDHPSHISVFLQELMPGNTHLVNLTLYNVLPEAFCTLIDGLSGSGNTTLVSLHLGTQDGVPLTDLTRLLSLRPTGLTEVRVKTERAASAAETECLVSAVCCHPTLEWISGDAWLDDPLARQLFTAGLRSVQRTTNLRYVTGDRSPEGSVSDYRSVLKDLRVSCWACVNFASLMIVCVQDICDRQRRLQRCLQRGWENVAPVIGFVRANHTSALRYSVLPLLYEIIELCSDHGYRLFTTKSDIHSSRINLSAFTHCRFFLEQTTPSAVQSSAVAPAAASESCAVAVSR